MRKKIRMEAACAAVLLAMVTTVPVFAASTTVIPTDGSGTLIQNDSDSSSQLEFFTIKTPAGNVFYLVVDKSKTDDNVYFLTPATEADLAALTGSKTTETSGNTGPSTTGKSGGTASQTTSAQTKTVSGSTAAAKKTQSSGGTGVAVFAVVVVLLAGGAGFYFKIYRPRHETVDDDSDGNEREMPEETNEDPRTSDGIGSNGNDGGEV